MPIETLINAVKHWAERTFATDDDIAAETTLVEVSDKVLIDLEVSTTNGGGSSGMYHGPFRGFKPEVGKEYKVTFDGVEYTEVAELFRGADYFGKEGIVSIGYDEDIYCADENDAPFVYLYMPDTDESYVYSNAWEEHRIEISVEGGEKTVKRVVDAVVEIEDALTVSTGDVVFDATTEYWTDDLGAGCISGGEELVADIKVGEKYTLQVGDIVRSGVAKIVEYDGSQIVVIGDYEGVDEDFCVSVEPEWNWTGIFVDVDRPDLSGVTATVYKNFERSEKSLQDVYGYIGERTSVTYQKAVCSGLFSDGASMPYEGYELGAEYSVEFNGKMYDCTCAEAEHYYGYSVLCVGNLSILSQRGFLTELFDDTGEPFCIMYNGGSAKIYSFDRETYSYTVYAPGDSGPVGAAVESVIKNLDRMHGSIPVITTDPITRTYTLVGIEPEKVFAGYKAFAAPVVAMVSYTNNVQQWQMPTSVAGYSEDGSDWNLSGDPHFIRYVYGESGGVDIRSDGAIKSMASSNWPS